MMGVRSWVLVFFLFVSSVVFAMNSQLELVLADGDNVLDGEQSLTVSLHSPSNVLLWSETHSKVMFFQGVCSIELGTIVPIRPFDFYEFGAQLSITVQEETIQLPMHTVPFSMFSYAADLVNYIHMDGVFHSDVENKRVGIKLNVPTPSATLEVNGALRIGDTDQAGDPGMMRWRNGRLEGFHANSWQMLDVSAEDALDSKWKDVSLPVKGVYVTKNVLIGTKTSMGKLTVGGKAKITGSLVVHKGVVDIPSFSSEKYAVSSAGEVKIQRLILGDNYFNKIDGLVVSGSIIGKGSGLYDIVSDNISALSVGNNDEIADHVFTNAMFQDDSVSGNKIQDTSIASHHLMSGFRVPSQHLLGVVLSSANIQSNTIAGKNIADNFDMFLYSFSKGSVGSVNFDSDSVVSKNIADRSIDENHFQTPVFSSSGYSTLTTGLVESRHISNYQISLDHFQFDTMFDYTTVSFLNKVPLPKGGTGSGAFSTGNILVVDSSVSKIITSNGYVTSAGGLSLSPNVDALFSINMGASTALPILIESNGTSEMVYKSGASRWKMSLSDSNGFSLLEMVEGEYKPRLIKKDGKYGFNHAIGTELLRVGGGLKIGNKAEHTEGTLYYVSGSNATCGSASNTFCFVPPDKQDREVSAYFPEKSMFIPSYLYSYYIDDASLRSRVLLGDFVRLEGDDHLIQGGRHLGVSGRDNVVTMGHYSDYYGENSVMEFGVSSNIFVQDTYISHVKDTHVMGDQHSVVFDQKSRISGKYHTLSQSEDVDVHGVNHMLSQVRYSDIDGSRHHVSFATGSKVFGKDVSLLFSYDTRVLGDLSLVSYPRYSHIQGDSHMLEHVSNTTVSGTNHSVFQSLNASISGSNHLIVHGRGHYSGSNHRHIGGGAPDILGQGNTVLGVQNVSMDSGRQISIGTSVLSSQNAYHDAIVIHAPGGVDIVSNDIVLAHLPKNGGSWTHVSDQALKHKVFSIDPALILEKVSKLSIYEWHYNGQQYISHLGPMAQDFYQEFSLGGNERLIQSLDMDGVIFSSIQALGHRIYDMQSEYEMSVDKKSSVLGLMDALATLGSNLTSSGQDISIMDQQLSRRFLSMHEGELGQNKRIRDLSKRIEWIQQHVEIEQ
jgi:hypothetical protein